MAGAADEAEIARVLWEYGEERQSRRIARKLVEVRQSRAIEDTASLASIDQRGIAAPEKPQAPGNPQFPGD